MLVDERERIDQMETLFVSKPTKRDKSNTTWQTRRTPTTLRKINENQQKRITKKNPENCKSNELQTFAHCKTKHFYK